MKYIPILLGLLVLNACDKPSDQPVSLQAEPQATIVEAPIASASRHFSAEQVTLGRTIFKENCRACHGKAAQGETSEWQKVRADGTAPAPPLDGSAHAWHHNMKSLMRTINNGGAVVGGRMPPFKKVLTKDEKMAVLSYIQSLWPDKIYQIWLKKNT